MSVESSPCVVFTTMGKKLISQVTAMIPGKPEPIQSWISGVSTMTGVICSTSSQG